MSSPAARFTLCVVSVLAASPADAVFTPLFVWVVREVMIPPLFVTWCDWHPHLTSFLLFLFLTF
eukprot:1151881-Amphidinium_carterae.1